MITKNTLISDILEKYPAAIDVLTGKGIQCFGCGGANFETVEQGFSAHGMSEAEIDDVLVKMNAAAAPKNEAEQKISISPLAVEKIKAICVSKEKEALRLGIKAGGCSGYSYTFDLAESRETDDVVVEQDGAVIYINKEQKQKLAGILLDYNDGLTGAGFTVKNPGAAATCACGTSFR